MLPLGLLALHVHSPNSSIKVKSLIQAKSYHFPVIVSHHPKNQVQSLPHSLHAQTPAIQDPLIFQHPPCQHAPGSGRTFLFLLPESCPQPRTFSHPFPCQAFHSVAHLGFTPQRGGIQPPSLKFIPMPPMPSLSHTCFLFLSTYHHP